MTMDEDWRLVYMNVAAAEIFQVDVDPWIGRDLRDLLRERAPDLQTALEETLRSGRRVRNREVEILPPLAPRQDDGSPGERSADRAAAGVEAGAPGRDDAAVEPPPEEPLPVVSLQLS